MNLTTYLMKMISQESCALSKLSLANDENNCNHEAIMAVFNRLNGFVKDYDEFSRTNDII